MISAHTAITTTACTAAMSKLVRLVLATADTRIVADLGYISNAGGSTVKGGEMRDLKPYRLTMCLVTSLALMLGATMSAHGAALGDDPVTSTPSDAAAESPGMGATLSAAPTATSTPWPSDTPTATPTSTPSSTATPTAFIAPASPSLSVSAPTHCRMGLGAPYDIVFTMLPGMLATVVGSDLARDYWLIAVPGSSGATCWIWGYYAQVAGNTSMLPAAATATPSGYVYTLSEPKNLMAACSAEPYEDDGDDEDNDIDDASAWTVVFSWTNTEPNAQGVRVYRNNQRIAILSPGARSYTDYFIHYDYYHGARYGVQAFSGNAVSAIVWTYMNSCR